MKPYTMTDAEAELRDAIDADDHEAIQRLAPTIDQLDVRRSEAALGEAALWYAQVGLRVFPLSPGTKIPFKGSRGCLDATTDADRITAWWARTPDANIGIATGHLVDVVDIDGHAGQRSRVAHWEDIFAQVDTDSLGKVLTPRKGGMHIYVPTVGDPNGTNLVPSVDYRGAGGYVVAPPSRTPEGRYRWLGMPDFTTVTRGVVA